jgi:hypothetical protein
MEKSNAAVQLMQSTSVVRQFRRHAAATPARSTKVANVPYCACVPVTNAQSASPMRSGLNACAN